MYDTVDTVSSCLRIAEGVIATLTVRPLPASPTVSPAWQC